MYVLCCHSQHWLWICKIPAVLATTNVIFVYKCECVFVCVFNFICDDNNRIRDELPWLQHQHPTIGQATMRSNQGRCLIISSAWRIVKWVMDLLDDFNNPMIMIIMGLFARSFACVSVIFATDVHSHKPYQPINKLVKIP